MDRSYFDTIQRARKGYSRALEPVCAQWALCRGELDVLIFLANNPGCDRAADVAIGRGMAKSQVSMAVSALEGRGMVERSVDAEDRRTVRIRLTERAADAVRSGQEAQERFFREIFRDITGAEMALWNGILEKVQGNIARLNV